MSKLYPWLALLIAMTIAMAIGTFVDQNDINWRLIDVAAVMFGSVGIVTLIGDAQRIYPLNRLAQLRARADSNLLTLESVCTSYASLAKGRMGTNLGASLQSYQEALSWFEEGAAFIASATDDKLPDVRNWFDRFVIAADEAELVLLKNHIGDIVVNYGVCAREFESTRHQLERGAVEEFFVLISPYLITVTIGCSLLKACFAPL